MEVACQIWKSSRFTLKTLSINLLSIFIKLFFTFFILCKSATYDTNRNYF